jgi:urease gamma subunit
MINFTLKSTGNNSISIELTGNEMENIEFINESLVDAINGFDDFTAVMSETDFIITANDVFTQLPVLTSDINVYTYVNTLISTEDFVNSYMRTL